MQIQNRILNLHGLILYLHHDRAEIIEEFARYLGALSNYWTGWAKAGWENNTGKVVKWIFIQAGSLPGTWKTPLMPQNLPMLKVIFPNIRISALFWMRCNNGLICFRSCDHYAIKNANRQDLYYSARHHPI